VKRAGQALEARLLTERLLDTDPDALIVVVGDLNADLYEVPLRILRAEAEHVGNAALRGRVLSPVEEVVPEGRRFTALHHGKRLMLDHLLVSAKLLNEDLPDEVDTAEQGAIGGYGTFSRADFTFDKDRNVYVCPMGKFARVA
jgi:hypothetical protein